MVAAHAQAIFWKTDRYRCERVVDRSFEHSKHPAGIVAALLQCLHDRDNSGQPREIWVVTTHLSSGTKPEAIQERSEEMERLQECIADLKKSRPDAHILLGLDANHRMKEHTFNEWGLTSSHRNGSTACRKFTSVVKMRGPGTEQAFKMGKMELHTIDFSAASRGAQGRALPILPWVQDYHFHSDDIAAAKSCFKDPRSSSRELFQRSSAITSRMLPNDRCMSDHVPICVQWTWSGEGGDVTARTCQWNLLAEVLSKDGFMTIQDMDAEEVQALLSHMAEVRYLGSQLLAAEGKKNKEYMKVVARFMLLFTGRRTLEEVMDLYHHDVREGHISEISTQ